MVVGIPRSLNMYENFPFWHTLLTACGIEVRLSGESTYSGYEQSARMVMSDNICFPAKLVHGHVQNLIAQKVDRIFLPFVIFERKGAEQLQLPCCDRLLGSRKKCTVVWYSYRFSSHIV